MRARLAANAAYSGNWARISSTVMSSATIATTVIGVGANVTIRLPARD